MTVMQNSMSTFPTYQGTKNFTFDIIIKSLGGLRRKIFIFEKYRDLETGVRGH